VIDCHTKACIGSTSTATAPVRRSLSLDPPSMFGVAFVAE